MPKVFPDRSSGRGGSFPRIPPDPESSAWTKREATCDDPLHLFEQCDPRVPRIVKLAPSSGTFEIRRVRTFGVEGGYVRILRIGNVDASKLPGPVDAAVFSGKTFEAPWGTISPDEPLEVEFEQMSCYSVSPILNLVVYGRWTPAPAVEAEAAPDGRDPFLPPELSEGDEWLDATGVRYRVVDGQVEMVESARRQPWGIPSRE